MEQKEKIKTVIDITSVSEGTAIHALDMCNWDVVDAIVYIKNSDAYPQSASEQPKAEQQERPSQSETKSNFLDKLLGVSFLIEKNNERVASIPLLLVILLILFMPKIAIVILIALMFFNHRYTVSEFPGAESVNKGLNAVNTFVDKIVVFFKKNGYHK